MTRPERSLAAQAGPDERLALPIEQGVLLWCMRAWVAGTVCGAEVGERIDALLTALGAPGAAPGLARFMRALGQGCTRTIGVRCPCRTRLDADERALLDVLALVQATRPFEARLILRGFVTRAGAAAALHAAEQVAAALSRAGLFLPEPEQEVRHGAIMPSRSGAFAGPGTLH